MARLTKDKSPVKRKTRTKYSKRTKCGRPTKEKTSSYTPWLAGGAAAAAAAWFSWKVYNEMLRIDNIRMIESGAHIRDYESDLFLDIYDDFDVPYPPDNGDLPPRLHFESVFDKPDLLEWALMPPSSSNPSPAMPLPGYDIGYREHPSF